MTASTHDRDVFSFYSDERFCNGFEEVLKRYRELVPHLRLAGCDSISLFSLLCLFWLILSASIFDTPLFFLFPETGPTSFAPIVEMAITIVEQSGGQYHVLLIIADGQVFPYLVWMLLVSFGFFAFLTLICMINVDTINP